MKKALLGVLGIMAAAMVAPAVATAADDWKFAVTPYLWGAGINGTATVALHEADVNKSFSDILNDLDFAMMVNLQARKGRFGLYTDVTFMGLERHDPGHQPRRSHDPRSLDVDRQLDRRLRRVVGGCALVGVRGGEVGFRRPDRRRALLESRHRDQDRQRLLLPVGCPEDLRLGRPDRRRPLRRRPDAQAAVDRPRRRWRFRHRKRIEVDLVRERLSRLALQPAGQRLGRLEVSLGRARGRPGELDRPGLQRAGAWRILHVLRPRQVPVRAMGSGNGR